ncbi:MAG: PAS domain S-box protein [Deltaproteobacteria bacterium]|nr:PAS domain S-box protein [Deltaproteobacteria bacterium]
MPELLKDLAGMADGVIAVEGDQRILLWNRAAEKLLGVSAKEALGRYCYELMHGRNELGALLCRQACRTMALAKKGKPIPSTDMLTLTKAGRQLWLNVSHFVTRSTSNRVALIHIFRDISLQKAMEHLIRQLSTTLAGLGSQVSAGGRAPDPEAGLTPREQQVLKLLAGGVSTLSMAERLHISRSTVRNHIQHILSKLGTHSRLEAVALGVRHQLF